MEEGRIFQALAFGQNRKIILLPKWLAKQQEAFDDGPHFQPLDRFVLAGQSWLKFYRPVFFRLSLQNTQRYCDQRVRSMKDFRHRIAGGFDLHFHAAALPSHMGDDRA